VSGWLYVTTVLSPEKEPWTIYPSKGPQYPLYKRLGGAWRW